MSSVEGIFYVFAAVTILSALGILLVRNVLYGAFLLVLSFLGVAALYVLAGASFIGVTQLLIYAGGILVLMIFGLMLTNKIDGKAVLSETHNRFIGVAISAVIFILLFKTILSINFSLLGHSVSALEEQNVIRQIGVRLMSEYLVPFEVVAVLLLIALIGAVALSERRKGEQS